MSQLNTRKNVPDNVTINSFKYYIEDYLNVNEKLKYEVIKQVVEGKKTKK